MIISRRHILTLALTAPVVAAFAPRAMAATPQIYAEDGIAVDGTDVVAYFTQGAPVAGDAFMIQPTRTGARRSLATPQLRWTTWASPGALALTPTARHSPPILPPMRRNMAATAPMLSAKATPHRLCPKLGPLLMTSCT